ncbi:hypothetical protein QVD17_06140 [Tagetes erecta]|uniref:Transposase MuDR plant domain-containing protein n=1 Tax=Tagetes erecta TaxID=13708 RepID=A0AAD8LD86_TARER|nr:hypothetical protein QVD17_06140 [Tagetes erecta]
MPLSIQWYNVEDVGMFEENVVLNNDMAEVENRVTNHAVNDFEFSYQDVGDLFDENDAIVEEVDEESVPEKEDDYSDDMEDFKAAVDVDVDESNSLSDGDLLDSELDIDDFDSLSEDDDPSLKKVVRKLRRQRRRDKDPVSEPFYVGQQFTNKKEISEFVKKFAADSERQLKIKKNDKTRFSVVCDGTRPVFDLDDSIDEDGKTNSDKAGV